jgi:AraC-like DNA-binding protein
VVEQNGVVRASLETGDPEQAREWLAAGYAEHVARLSGSREDFRLRLSSVGTDRFRVDDMVHTMCMDSQVEPYDALAVTNPRSGVFWAAQGWRAEVRQGPGGLVLMDGALGVHGGWSPIDQRVVRMEGPPLRRMVEELTGCPASRVRFELSLPLGPERARLWVSAVEYVRSTLCDSEVAGWPLVRAESFRMLVSVMLTVFPNNALAALTDPFARGTGRAEPAVVRRAVEFIDANAHRPISMREIGEAAGIGARGLEMAFLHHRDQTPLGYLRRVRLEGAHRDLQTTQPDGGITVAAVAARWGFANIDRFVAAYARVYGYPPGGAPS